MPEVAPVITTILPCIILLRRGRLARRSPAGGYMPRTIGLPTGRAVADIGAAGDIDGLREGPTSALRGASFGIAIDAVVAAPGAALAAFERCDLRLIGRDAIVILQPKPHRSGKH